MPITFRLVSVAFCYRDTANDIKNPEKELSKYQQEYKLDKLPSLLEYWSYSVTTFGNILGPFFEFKDYINYVN